MSATMRHDFLVIMSNTPDELRLAAWDRELAADPRNVRALIGKADYYAAAGDARSAGAFYIAALRAAPPQERAPPELAAHLRRAREMCAQYEARYKSYVRDQLAARGFDPERRSNARFGQSVDVILGQKQIFVQQPRYYYFPELPQIQFYDRALFDWIPQLEAET